MTHAGRVQNGGKTYNLTFAQRAGPHQRRRPFLFLNCVLHFKLLLIDFVLNCVMMAKESETLQALCFLVVFMHYAE